jgi:hypothetical protein
MGGDKQDLPTDAEAIEEAAEKNREELDKVPPPGTDPLHEGP